MKVLITGANGYVGTHYCNYLNQISVEIHSLARVEVKNTKHWSINDVDDRLRIQEVLGRVNPDVLLHLAGNPYTSSEEESKKVNVNFLKHLLSAIEKVNLRGHVRCCIFGSAAEYGPSENPRSAVTEHQECKPVSQYGLHKLKQTQVALQKAQEGHKIIIVRPFTILGPGMPKKMVIQKILDEAEMFLGQPDQKVVSEFQNLNIHRDFIDVQDVVRLSWQLLFNDSALNKIVNLCSGIPVPLQLIVAFIYKLYRIRLDIDWTKSIDTKSSMDFHYGSNRELTKLSAHLSLIDWRTSIKSMVK